MLDPQFFPWCASASPTSPLPWCPSSVVPPEAGRRMEEGLEPAPYLIRGEGEKYTPGIVKLWESPGRVGGLPRIYYHNPEYEEAVGEFYRRHVCRLAEWPEPLERTGENLTDNPVYETMNGPNEFMVIGNLKDWDRTDRLREITVPTVITVGRYDELTPACAETLLEGIPGSKMVVFEESAHVAYLEETEKYLKVVAGFLADVEGRR